MTDFRVPLGALVLDKITLFRGIVVARSEYLNGCRSLGVERFVDPPKEAGGSGELAGETLVVGESEDNRMRWFDEQRLVILDAAWFEPEPSVAKVGGPGPRPRRSTPPGSPAP